MNERIEEIKPGSDRPEPGYSIEPDNSSNSLQWWTLSQRIRTFAQIPFESEIRDIGTAPFYQQIAPKALHLKLSGLSDSLIAKSLGVTDKTVTKAVRWFWRIEHRFNN